ncbi:hypothetical protein [Absidia glauca]|uniref:Uncharacterized protein n=1 Tax=Absidia glauca TaxID=4829 RepID=A0A163JR60_ABSGL|nr:hypothetical protein [Absidia glauca]
MGDIKLLSSRSFRHRRRRYRRHRRSQSKVEKKSRRCKKQLVSQGKKMNKMVGRVALLCIRRLRWFHRGRVVRSVMSKSIENKSDEEVKEEV